MKKLSISVLLMATFCFSNAFAGGGHDAVLDKVNVNLNDKAALRNGAKLFVNFCLSCHSAKYSRYNRVAEDLDIPEEVMLKNLMFTTDKIGELMITTMPEKDAKEWFGVAPPDLSLSARVRGSDWLYTYLRAFYTDESTPSGWNNSLFESVAMPHVLYELQGVQRLVGKHSEATLSSENKNTTVVGDSVFELTHPGALSPAEYDKNMRDLTAFLTYLAEPIQLQRKKIGVFVLMFLIILTGLIFLLKKEYWRNIH